MFNFTHVLNASTGERYYIDQAALADNGEGYDETPNGGNLFEIDLQPQGVSKAPICGIDLYVCNNGYAVQISKNLGSADAQQDGDVCSVQMVDALIEGKTLIITNQE